MRWRICPTEQSFFYRAIEFPDAGLQTDRLVEQPFKLVDSSVMQRE